MREGLRSSSSKKEDVKVGLEHSVSNLRRVKIPDLNLEDDPDDILSEEVEILGSEVSKADGKSNGVVCEKEGVGEDEGKGMEVEDGGEVYATPEFKCSRVVGVEGEVVAAEAVGDVDLSMGVCSTRGINDEKKIDEFFENVGGEEKAAGVEGLKCSVDSDDRALESALAVDKKKGSGDDEGLVRSSVEGSRSINGNCDGETEDMEEHVDADPKLSKDLQSNLDAQMESPEKESVSVGIKCKFDEVDGCKGFKKEAKQERVQVAARVLRSRVVPANGLGEETEGNSIGFLQRKRKRVTDGLKEAAVVVEDESSRSALEKSYGIRKSKRSTDNSGEELVEPNNARVVSEIEDENVNNKLIGSSERKRKRGRPKLSRNHPEKEVNQTDEGLNSVSKVDEEGLDNKSASSFKKKNRRGRPRKTANAFENERVVPKVENEAGRNNNPASSKKKDGRGRPRKSANYLENEKAAPIKVENEGVDLSNRSVEILTPRRISGRPKRTVDYSEEQIAQKKKKLSFSKVEDEAPAEVEDKSLSDRSVRKSKKKGKRGRPKKEPETDAVKIVCHDNGKVKGDRDLKVSPVAAPVRRSRRDSHPPKVSEKPSDEVPLEKVVRSGKKVNFVGLDKDTVGRSSKGEETPLPENNSPAKRKRAEIAGSLSSEKNAIRNQIVEMLLSAGWTIEYRPRNGREYKDAVYVNREGKTHWSVTKAYNSLQQEAEEGKASENFTFNPLPAEVLSKLFRIVSKTRSDKNKKKKNNQDGDTSDEEGSASRKAGAKQKHFTLKGKPSVRVGAQGRRRCALVVRRSNQDSTSEIDGAIAHSGKHSVLARMIDLGTVSLDGKVHYKNHHDAESVLEGSITRDGIHCCCCKEIISVSDFENHAGSKLYQPYENIYLESGSSLLQCLLDSWNKQDETGRLGFHGVNVNVDDPNDDTCAICGDGGDLMCCDGCPSTFHLDCLDIEEFPLGEWHCVFCSCKFCGVGGDSATATEEVESDTVSSQLVTCTFCEEKYHKSCIREEDDLSAKSRRPYFCGRNCAQMSERLKSLLGAKCDLGDGYSWTLLQRSDFKEESVILEPQKIQNNSKLAVALSVMEECFLPIFDQRSGVNLIRHVIYSCGSNFNRLNFSSFLTVVLEKGDEVISAASIRIRGKQLAEMPFIGTRNVYRRKGMCRRLLAAIGQALGTLEIENLVIPAITELTNTWTSVFGFNPLEESIRREMRSMNMLVFAHTDMLQKPIVNQQFAEKSTSFIEKDADSGVSQNDQIDCPAVKTDADKPEIDDGCLNGKFDLNCVAPNAPDSSSDEKCLVHPDSDAENCEDDVKRRMNYGDDKNDDGRTGVSDIVMNSSELRTLHPDLNLMAETDSFSDEKSHGCHGPDTMNFDEVAKSTSNSSGLTNVKECCTVESDDDQNGDSTSVRSSEEKVLKYDLNLEGKVLEDDDSLRSNSTSVGAPFSRLDGQESIDHLTTQGNDNLLEVTNCCSSQNVDGETGPSAFPAAGQVSEIKYSEVETSKANDLGSNTGDLTAGAELLTKSTKCSDSESKNSLVVCTRVAQVTTESSCNLSSAAGESCVAGVFHGSGMAKVGPTKS
ncbi:uncharacterized protein LOC110682747 [Chenopodium quinoa]|uniref:uncharacterized protein LOC110682747 n=1 Tax=Chenopodium quinoa TaxID=63459 RepID=UPI000B781823|nr:uncharacterized protein LOC110682747 [Chenopodium quinoa]